MIDRKDAEQTDRHGDQHADHDQGEPRLLKKASPVQDAKGDDQQRKEFEDFLANFSAE